MKVPLTLMARAVEIMAERGSKPSCGPATRWLVDPHRQKPYAVVQLRQGNQLDTLPIWLAFEAK